ncbi:MAG: RDD family protein [Flammeovirgaceae bacterium]|nr:RDD family protein [Flammeovirgaceae bacterium]MBE62016.1 RDD family protein [Flammeovirgaceae bacterium]MBR10091.1 RDD family protein [Rickettsiales bacterium]HCX20869.1 RDD family protein [Cytophagales bacterium]
MTKFITNQNIEIQLELASLGDRILATIIDFFIMGCYALVAGLISSSTGGGEVLAFLIFIPLAFYSLLFEYFMHGQSPGKHVRDIKVVKLDGGAPGIGNYLLRWLIRPIDILFYGAVAVLTIIISKKGQRLGDLAAGTTVIKVKRRESIESIKSIKKEEDYQIQFPQVKRLSDKQVGLIRKSLKMGVDGLNYEAIGQLTEKVKELLQVKSDLPDVKFLYTIIADYEHLDE